MTASDIPTTTGMPNNGFEGMRFLGYPIFEGLTLWDLTRSDTLAGLRPGLAEKWVQDKADPTKWIFSLRRGVKFHDGSDFNADAVIWNLERFYNPQSKQFETQGGAISRARNPWLKAWRKIDDFTVEITTNRPVSYFPYVITYTLIASPTQFEKTGASWAEFAKAPAGTGPFKITEVKPRVSVELSQNAAYWDKNRIPKLDKMVLTPMPEPTTRLAALRSGQVDWIEVPPPDAVPSLKQAGFEVVTGVYPHVWPWVLESSTSPTRPGSDVRVRQAANYCVDREGLVKLLNGLAYPSVGFFTKANPLFGKPKNAYTLDPAKAKALLKEAGYGPDKPVKAKIMISTSGSGQMLPLPMNEFLQQSHEAVRIRHHLRGGRVGRHARGLPQPADRPAVARLGRHRTSAWSPRDVSRMAALFLSTNFPPNGANWGHWKNETFDGALLRIERSSDPKEIEEQTRRAHEQLSTTRRGSGSCTTATRAR